MDLFRSGSLRLLLVFIVLLSAVLLLSKDWRLKDESISRHNAIRVLAPVVQQDGEATQLDIPISEQAEILDPVQSGTINFADVVISTDAGDDNMEQQFLRGEIDFEDYEGRVSRAERLALMVESEKLAPDSSLGRAPVAVSSLTAGASWEALDFADSGGGRVPPDPEIAVGTSHVLTAYNIDVQIFDKTGTSVFGPTLAQSMFTNANCTSGLFDPVVAFDEESERWILAYDKGVSSSTGGMCMLVSQTDNPLGVWNEYFFSMNSSTEWVDYPQLGVGDEYIFISGNFFNLAGTTYTGSKIYAFDKSDLYAGSTVTPTSRDLGTTYFTSMPLMLHGAEQGTWPALGAEHYFLSGVYDGTNYTVFRWNVATDTLTSNVISFGTGSYPVVVNQSGTTNLDGNDWRIMDFEYRNGYGWTTQTIACNPGSGTVDCVRWVQIDLNHETLTPTLNTQNTISSNNTFRWVPDLAVNHCDDMLAGYSRVTSSTFPSAVVSGVENGVATTEQVLKAGEVPYTSFQGSGSTNRWGDYTGMTVDPNGEDFWYLGQYAEDLPTETTKWATQVGVYTYTARVCDVPADLEITITADSLAPEIVGNSVTYTIVVENDGSGFGDMTAANTFPTQLDAVSCVIQNFDEAGNETTQTAVSFPLSQNDTEFRAYESVTYKCTGTINATACPDTSDTTIDNTATAIAPEDTNNPAGVTDTAIVPVSCSPTSISLQSSAAEQSQMPLPVLGLLMVIGAGLFVVGIILFQKQKMA